MEAYITYFKLLAQIQEWDQQEMVVWLVLSMTGPAVEV